MQGAAYALEPPEKPLLASSIAAVQRSAIPAEFQRLTLRQRRRIAPIMFSMMFVHASGRLSSWAIQDE